VKTKLFDGTPKWYRKVWFYFTCLRPITKLELSHLQLQLITILEGMREADLQHYQVERMLENAIQKMNGGKQGNDVKEKQENKDQMFG